MLRAGLRGLLAAVALIAGCTSAPAAAPSSAAPPVPSQAPVVLRRRLNRVLRQ